MQAERSRLEETINMYAATTVHWAFCSVFYVIFITPTLYDSVFQTSREERKKGQKKRKERKGEEIGQHKKKKSGSKDKHCFWKLCYTLS